MNTQTPPDSRTARGQERSAEASGKHQGLHQPNDDQRVEQTLDKIGLEDDPESQGEMIEDQLRDRRGSGIPAVDDERNDRR